MSYALNYYSWYITVLFFISFECFSSTPVFDDSLPTCDVMEPPIVPIFSLDALKNNTSDLMDALQNVGCIYLKDHGISDEIIDTAVDGVKEFFAFPNKVKAQLTVDTNQRGWLHSDASDNSSVHAKMKYTNITDLKQVLFFGADIKSDDPDIGKPMVALNQWPIDFMPELPDKIYPYYNKIMKVGEEILEAIAVGLGLDTDFFKKYYQKPLGRGQLLYYPVPTDRDTQIYGVGPHTDLGVITLLLQDDNGGLQFYSRLCHEWIDVKPVESTLIINIGDLLAKWSGYRLHPTIHQVLNGNRNRKRYGIAIFYDPSSDAFINQDDMLHGNDQNGKQLKFVEPFFAGEYIANFNKKLFSHYKDTNYDDVTRKFTVDSLDEQ